MERHKLKFIDCRVDIPVVSFSLDNRQSYCAIVDSGAEQTIFDSGLIQTSDKAFSDERLADVSITGITDSLQHKAVRQVRADIILDCLDEGDVTVQADGVVFSLDHVNACFIRNSDPPVRISAILGTDFLKRYNAKLNFKKMEMTLDYDLSCKRQA